MKKILIAAAILVSTSSFATTTTTTTTSSKDKGNFKKYYTQEGDLIGSTRYQDFDKLPKNAIKTITSKYTFPEYNLQECIVFTNGYNESTYYVSMTTETDYLVLAITEYGEVSIFSNTRK